MSIRSFFGTLGQLAGTSQQENQASRTFLACFERSQFVRRQVLEWLRDACRIGIALPTAEHWTCAVEVPTPRRGGGRVDIRIAPTNGVGRSLPVFYLESKVESVLTMEQLKRYKRHGVEYLVAVTKYPPEITRKEL